MSHGNHSLRFRVALGIAALLSSPALHAAQNPAWDALKQLAPGQQIRVIMNDSRSYKGGFESVTDDVIVIHTKGGDRTLERQSVKLVSSRQAGHRGRHALIGAAVGAGAGLGMGTAIDADCSPQAIFCTGNRGKAILTPAFGLIGAGIGALLPAGSWQELYRAN